MNSSPTLIFRPSPTASSDAPPQHVVAFGEPDDHLRMTVLLASSASSALSRAGAGAKGVVETCREPRSSWRERREALRELLLYPSTPPYVIGDPEALLPNVPDQTPRWDDMAFHQERKELFDLLLDVAVQRGDWQFVSTALHPLLGEAFDKRGLAIEPSLTSLTDLPAISPQLRSRFKNICRVSLYLLDRRASRLSPQGRGFCELLQFARLGCVEPATQGPPRAVAQGAPCPAGSTHPRLAIAHRTPCPAGSTEMQTGLSPCGFSARSWASGPTPSHQTPPGTRIYVGSIGIYFLNGFSAAWHRRCSTPR